MVDIGSMSHIARFGVSEEKARERFSRGDLCYVAYKEGTAVNINWVHRGACYITSFGYYHNIGQNDYYIYNVSTHHTEREKGYYKIALELLARELRELGGRNVTQLINSKNYIALDTVNKLGYDKEKVLIFEELLFVKKAIVRDMRTQEEDQHIFLFHPIHEISI